MIIAKKLSDIIGNTDMMDLSKLYPNCHSRVLGKLEFQNPMSVKDRAVLSMVTKAIAAGKISENTEVVDASSGNTAIGLASLGTEFLYKSRIYMSESASIERRQILSAYGATVVLTPAAEHTRGARDRAIRYCERNPDTTFFLNQHSNPDNGAAHEEFTGPEIWEQTHGDVDAVVIGLGTSGTFDGLSRFFKAKKPDIKIIGFEPATSPVYSGGKQGSHKLMGIGPGFVTDNYKRSKKNIDELLLVDDQTSYEMVQTIAKTLGILIGPTSGAAAWVTGELVKREEYKNKTIVCLLYDSGERYLSTPGLFPERNVIREP